MTPTDTDGRADVCILKLGGSVITDKNRPETVDTEALERAVSAIARALESASVEQLVVVHGGGSFGHVHASEHGVSTTEGTHDPNAIDAIHAAMGRLNRAVQTQFLERSVPAVPVQPLASAYRDCSGTLHLPTGHLEAMLAEGFVPVLHGDVVTHSGSGATILSGDELVVELARALESDRIGLCSTVPGVLDASGAVVDRIDTLEGIETILGESDATDVTGGMAAKVSALLSLKAQASIFGLEALPAFLAGDAVGTTIE